MIFYTADTHFGHKNIIRYCDRPFADVETMDRALIDNWNRKVQPQDTVFILGDFIFANKHPDEILEKLNGKKRLIIGNHDHNWMKKSDLSKHFESVDYYLETKVDERILTMCHYPMVTWNRQNYSYMIYGHIHNDTDFDFWPILKTRDNALNAGADVNNYEPVTFEEMLENNRRFKEAH